MKTIVIMLHNRINQLTLSKQLERIAQGQSSHQEPIQIVSIPLPDPKQDQVESIAKLKAELEGKVAFRDVYAFIIESNYGFPSQELVDFDILQFGIHSFAHAKIIAYSSTLHSLVMAAKLDDRVSVCHATSTQVDAVIDSFNKSQALEVANIDTFRERVFTRNLHKELAELICSEDHDKNVHWDLESIPTITFAAKSRTQVLIPHKNDNHQPDSSMITDYIYHSP